MKKIIFVCTGNTCRSPMAEVLAASLCKNLGIKFESRGLFVPCPAPASVNSVSTVKSLNLSLENHISKQLTLNDVEDSLLILTMTNAHKTSILQAFGKDFLPKVFTLYEYTLSTKKDIQDPYGLPLKEYVNCFNELLSLIRQIDFNKI